MKIDKCFYAAVFVSSIILSGALSAAQSAGGDDSTWPYRNETKQQRDERMQWWREARFGMFIHWGVYSVPAGTYNDKQISGIGEWIMNRGKIPVAEYKEFARHFNPVKYDADGWVALAKQAGMKYIVITSKHHDGFALFDSKVTDWDVVDATPYGKDLLKPLAEACRKHGIRLGFYYSQAQDWNHPGGAAAGGHWDIAQDGDMNQYIKDIAVPQVKEILTNYGDIAVLWWDTPENMNRQRADMLQPLIELQPGIITNNRLGADYRGDLETPEQYIPATGLDYDWETCMTMNDTWGYKSYDNNWKSTKTLLRNLVDIASKGGNYLLNVGPTSLGEIPAESIERLKEIGEWMQVNGESIYATTASPFTGLAWGRCTKKVQAGGLVLYLHIFDLPEDGKLIVPGLRNAVKKAYVLADKKTLDTQVSDEGVIIHIGPEGGDEIDTVVVLEVSGDLKIEKVFPKQSADGTVNLSAATADINNPSGGGARVETIDGSANIGYWTNPRTTAGWKFRIDKPGLFDVSAIIASPSACRFELVVDGKTLVVESPLTDSYTDFVNAKLGSAAIGSAGVVELLIKPVEGSWSPINLRSVTLSPAQ